MINFLIFMIMALISVAFLTLNERKILSLMQNRIGPNKLGIMGIIQPMSDAVKLYTKEYNNPTLSNKMLFFLFPIMSIFIALNILFIFPTFKSIFTIKFSLMMLLLFLGLGVYPTLFMGWSSNSSYSNIGSIRSVAQTISYEISLSFIILPMFLIYKSMTFYKFEKIQSLSWNFFLLPTMIMWVISCLAELNRTPFDLAEAESELVSGFNTEFSGGKFAIIFMAEYLMIIILSMFTSMMFFNLKMNSPMFIILSNFMMFFFIWMRATLPRMRYDKLMSLTWTIFLPSSLIFLSFSFFILIKSNL
uniref:NADH-ubiquinone oxidoreductase chain 1 n=1 Tax=Rhipiphorothrips cruentatus TaxID=764491 RepID=A0A8A5L5H3_9NEOP|nr:NADH dehydrogenase subunit 1 [Rhipiphorothrips cruentatus]